MAFVDNFLRPRHVAIVARDPITVNKFVAFLFEAIEVPDAKVFRPTLTNSHNHSRSFNVTRSPIEPLSADNIKANPKTLTIQGRMSANPLAGVIPTVTQAQGASFGSILRTDLTELEKLHKIADAREPVVVVTPERGYDSMAIDSISEQYDETTGNGCILTLTFSEMRVVSPDLVTGSPDVDVMNAAAYQEVNLGGQATEVRPDPGGLG